MALYDKDGLRRDPIHARSIHDRRKRDEDAWFYEEAWGLSVVCYPSGRQFVIPREAILAYARIVEGIASGGNRQGMEGGSD